MPCNQKSSHPLHFVAITDVTNCFRHYLALTRLHRWFNLFSSITHTYPDLPGFFLIVHHPRGFPFTQHKVVCRLLLTAVCGRPVLSLILAIPCSVRSASVFVLTSLKVFHLLHSTHFPVEEMIQDTHVSQICEVRPATNSMQS